MDFKKSKHFFAGNGSTTIMVPPHSWEVHNLSPELNYLIKRRGFEDFDPSLLMYIYPHNAYADKPYDGLLISKAFLDTTKSVHKRNRKNLRAFLKKALRKDLIPAKEEKAIWRNYKKFKRSTIHNMCMASPDMPLMGDCGAFSFINDKEPPYSTEEVLDYYTQYEFTQGVSVDHLVLNFVEDKKFRYDLTLANAEKFIKEHKKRGLPWTPIASLQGWNVKSYAKAALACAKMGYKYMAVGSIVKSSTEYIMRILAAIQTEFSDHGFDDIQLHMFGVTRFLALPTFAKMGAYSFDSTSVYVASWLKDGTNYLTPEGWHSCIRLPVTSKKLRNATAEELEASPITLEQLRGVSEKLADRIRKHVESGKKKVSKKLLDDVVQLNFAAYPLDPSDEKALRKRIVEVLTEHAWEKCPCRLCTALGIDIMLLHGRDLTAARAFHNLWAFHCQMYPRIMKGDDFNFLSRVTKPIYMKPIFDLDPDDRIEEG